MSRRNADKANNGRTFVGVAAEAVLDGVRNVRGKVMRSDGCGRKVLTAHDVTPAALLKSPGAALRLSRDLTQRVRDSEEHPAR